MSHLFENMFREFVVAVAFKHVAVLFGAAVELDPWLDDAVVFVGQFLGIVERRFVLIRRKRILDPDVDLGEVIDYYL